MTHATWGTVQDGIREALRDASGMADGSVAWSHTAPASNWATFPRLRIEAFGLRTFGRPVESYEWLPYEGRMIARVDSCTLFRVQVKIESERGSFGLGALFMPAHRLKSVIRSERIRAALETAGASVLTVGEFLPFNDSYDNRDLSVAIGEVQFQVNVPVILTPDGQSEDWFNVVELNWEVLDMPSATVFGRTFDELLIPGAGLPVHLRSGSYTGTGSDLSPTIPLPGRVAYPAPGERYRFTGVFLVRFGSTPIASISIRDVIVAWDGSAWNQVPGGDRRVTTYSGWGAYFADAAHLPGFGATGSLIQMVLRPISGRTVAAEFIGTVAVVPAT